MKLFRQDKALHQYQRLVREEEIIRRPMRMIYPYFFKDLIFFNDTVLHCWINKSLKKPKKCSIEFNIVLHFSQDRFEEDVYRLGAYLNDRISGYDRKCKCHISCGHTLLKKKFWSRNRPDLIFSFTIEDFPIREDILSKIYQVINEAKIKFGFSFSDKRTKIVERIKERTNTT